jgi:hypothetical protein
MADEKPLSGSPPGDRFGLHEAFAATAQTSCNRILEVFEKKKEPGVYPAVLF